MDLRTLIHRMDSIAESMQSAEHNKSGPNFGGYWHGTDKNPPKPGVGVGAAEESVLRELETELKNKPRVKLSPRDLMREFREYVAEYGGVGGYGAAAQTPQGSTAQKPDPAVMQQKIDQAQIQKSVNQIKPKLNQLGSAQQMNPTKFTGVMDKLDQAPNTNLSNAEQNQLGLLAVAASNILQNQQTAGQFKQLLDKTQQTELQKKQKVQQAQKKPGTNPAGTTATATAAPSTATGTTP